MTEFRVSRAYFIKLGRGGSWEAESLSDAVLRFGYREAPHDLCLAGDWDGVRMTMKKIRGDAGAATRDVSQIRAFYEADESTVFVTFIGGLMYWCRPSGPVELLSDRSHRRGTVDGWHSRSLGGVPLTSDRLSGHLLKVQMFRGTVCEIKAQDYLLRKLSDQVSPEIMAAIEAENALMAAVVKLMRLLTWQDFELLVDLIFSASGWRRLSVVGKTQKTVDLELMLPSTGERAFVQVKSEATNASLVEYAERFSATGAYDRMFFVWHTGAIADAASKNEISAIGPEKLARMVLDAGLSSWLREKVS